MQMIKDGKVKEGDAVEKAMITFKRKGRQYKLITMETRLEELEQFYRSGQEFAVVTDAARRFVLGVTTKADLEEFVRKRPA